jgi:subtilisin family serine protease
VFTLKRLVTSTALMLLLTGAAYGDDYVPGQVIVKFNSDPLLYLTGEEVHSQLQELESALVSNAVYYFEQTFPEPAAEDFNDNGGRWSFSEFYDNWEEMNLGGWYLLKYGVQENPEVVANVFEELQVVDIANADSYVKLCDPPPPVEPNDTYFLRQWYLHYDEPWSIDAQNAWRFQKGNPKFIVAVIDTGVKLNHLDLDGKLLPGFDFVWWTYEPWDKDDHGTCVAGIISAETNNTRGIAGVDWYARLLPVKVLEPPHGTFYTVAQGINWAVGAGADILNMSIGGINPPDVLEDACNNAWDNGRLLVASSGNIGDFGNVVNYPAGYSSVIGVGATEADGSLAYYSVTGPHVELTAPVNCYTTSAFLHGDPPRYYRTFAGTSAAAPVVSGVAALAWAHYETWTNLKIRKKLQGSVKDRGDPGWDPEYGWGIINAYYAVKPADNKGPGVLAGVDKSETTGLSFMASFDKKLLDKREPYAFPNPAKAVTTISFFSGTGFYDARIYDITGRKVKSWEGISSGLMTVNWDLSYDDGSSAGPGVYLVRVSDGITTNIIKTVVTR